MGKSKEVDAWFAKYDNPMKPVVQAMRKIILGADKRMEECIKWQAPTFTYKGNLASFFPKSKKHASLMFHQGAKIPGKHPRLEGTGNTSRSMKIGTVAEAKAAKADLVKIVKAWCAMQDDKPVKKKSAKKATKKAAKKRTTKRTVKKRATKKAAKKRATKKAAKKRATKKAAKKRATKKTAKKRATKKTASKKHAKKR